MLDHYRANLLLLRRSIAENRFEGRTRVVPNVVAEGPGETDLMSADVRSLHQSFICAHTGEPAICSASR